MQALVLAAQLVSQAHGQTAVVSGSADYNHREVHLQLGCVGEDQEPDPSGHLRSVESECYMLSIPFFCFLIVLSFPQVSKTTIEFIRLEAEVEDRSYLKRIQNRLDGATLKLPGFVEQMRIRASEPKEDFATRHDWDSFFRDAKNMDEMKAGERPDTVYIANLPIKWFCPRHQVNADHPKPSENIFKRIFEKFGDVRCVDIPICDPYRGQMKSSMTGLKTFSIDNETYFEG